MSAPPTELALDSETALARALFALRDLAGEAAHIALADDAPVEARERELTALASIVARTIAQLGALQELDVTDPVLEWDALAATGGGLEAADAWSAPAVPQSPQVADLAFAGALELRRIARELDAARDSDERLVAAEGARRKLRRAIRATLEAARIAGVDVIGGEHQGHHHVADLASGLAVRKLYARFRRALRRAEDRSPDAVLAAVRYAGGALATLVTAPDYADVRASDRAVLRRLRERALAWARGDRDVARGLQLIEDLWTCGDLLRGINQRQELQDHDRLLARACATAPAIDDDAAVADWLARLAPLAGRDDRIDALLDELAGEGPRDRARRVRELQTCLAGLAR